MKHNKILLLLTATAMLASCGGGASSPVSSATSGQETTSNSSAPLPSSDTGSASSSSASSSSAPYVPKAEDFGPLLYENGFIGIKGSLSIEMDKSTFTYEEGDPVVLETTYATVQTYSYQYGDNQYVESLPTIYFGDDARIRLGYGNYKFVFFEQKNESGKWVPQSRYMPATTEFAGVYNGFEEGSVDPNNILYLVSPNFNADIEGYDVKGGYRANGSLSSVNYTVQTFFVQEGDDMIVGMDFLDLSDGQYFQNPLTLSEKGLRSVADDPESRTDYFYADFSLLAEYLVDDKGNLLNYYYDSDDGLMDSDTWDIYGKAVVHHDAYGFYFTFGDTDPITARLNGAGMSIDYGNGDIRAVAPLFTLYSTISSSTMTLSKEGMTIEFGNDYNYDLWEYEFVCKVNGTSVEHALRIGNEGAVYISFIYEEVVYALYRQTEYSAVLISSDVEYVFDYDYLNSVFVGSFYAIENGVITNVTVNDDGTAKVGSSTFTNVAYDYDAYYDAVVCKFSDYSLIDVDHENGLFALEQGVEDARYLISDGVLQKALGTYKGKKTNNSNVAIEFSMEGLSYRGAQTTGLDFYFTLTDNYEFVAMFTFSRGSAQYYLQADFMGAANVFMVDSKNGGISFVESCLLASQYDELCGDYIFYSEEYGEEHFTYSADNGLWITTSHGSSATLDQYTSYQFSHNNNGQVVVTIAYSAEGTVIAVPFTQTGKYTISSPTGYTYLASEYYQIQGVYYNADHILYVNGTSVSFDGNACPGAAVEGSATNVVLTINDTNGVIFADGAASLKSGESDPVALTKYDLVLEDWVGTYTCADDDKTYELKIDPVTGKLTAYINGKFHWNVFSVVLEDGSVALRFSVLGTTVTFIYDGTNRTAKVTSSGAPIPPPPSF